MDNVRRSRSSSSPIVIAFLVWFVLIASSLRIVSVSAENAKETSESYSPYWERVKSAINQLQMKYFPPDLDFRSIFAPSDKGINEEGQITATETVKKAAEKSIQASVRTVEETAKSAAHVAEEAAHVAAEKVKDKIPVGSGDGSPADSEL